MPKLTEQLYFIRTSISHSYEGGSSGCAVPKLYQAGQARRVTRQKNKNPIYPADGPWEMVPVSFVEGEAIKE